MLLIVKMARTTLINKTIMQISMPACTTVFFICLFPKNHTINADEIIIPEKVPATFCKVNSIQLKQWWKESANKYRMVPAMQSHNAISEYLRCDSDTSWL